MLPKEVIINWLLILLPLLILWFISHRFALHRKQKSYLDRLEYFPLSIGSSIQLIRLGEDNFLLLAVTSNNVKLLKEGKLRELSKISENSENSSC